MPPERLAAEERAREEEEEKRRVEQEKLAKIREERDRERQEAAEKARLQQQREEEALERARQRQEEKLARERRPVVPPARVAAETEGVWRRTGPSTPVRTSVALPPARSESPAPAPKFRVGGASGGGWRAREAARKAEVVGPGPHPPSRPTTPAARPPPARDEPANDDEGFQPARNVWRPSRGRGGGTRA